MKAVIIAILSLLNFQGFGQNSPTVSVLGIKIFVKDLPKAKTFYTSVLGLKVLSENNTEIKLQTSEYPIYLYKATSIKARSSLVESHIGFSMETSKLLPAIDRLRKMNVKVHDTELLRNGVGIAIPFEDPSGNIIQLIEVQIREVEAFEGLRIYNSGISVKDMTKAIDLYENILGFEEWSKDYLPKALPLKHKDGSFAFMIHNKINISKCSATYGSSPSMSLMFKVSDIQQLQKYLTTKNIEVSKINGFLVIKDTEGNYLEIHKGL